MAQHRRASSSGQDTAVHLWRRKIISLRKTMWKPWLENTDGARPAPKPTPKHNICWSSYRSLSICCVLALVYAGFFSRVESGVNESIYVKLEWPSLNRGGGLRLTTYHPPTMPYWIPSPDNSETRSSHVSNDSVRTLPHKSLQLPSSLLELKRPLGWEVKCLQETETSPADYNTALRITMTWMTENLYQHWASY